MSSPYEWVEQGLLMRAHCERIGGASRNRQKGQHAPFMQCPDAVECCGCHISSGNRWGAQAKPEGAVSIPVYKLYIRKVQIDVSHWEYCFCSAISGSMSTTRSTREICRL